MFFAVTTVVAKSRTQTFDKVVSSHVVMTSKQVNHRTVHWFRKGLRLHDNPALLHAYETSTEIWPVYILNPEIITYGGNIGFNRWRFLLESLKDLDVQLRNFNSRYNCIG